MNKLLLLSSVLCLSLFSSPVVFAEDVTESYEFKKKVRKVVLVNTTGATVLKGQQSGPTVLKVTKKKLSKICEFRQELREATLYVGVRNRGFTGAGDCEVDLELSVLSQTQFELALGTGPVEIENIEGSIQFRTRSPLRCSPKE